MTILWFLLAAFAWLGFAFFISYRRTERKIKDATQIKGEPLSAKELASVKLLFENRALPAIELTPAAENDVTATGTRLGGPVWLAEGAALPTAPNGQKLSFLAQINFADLPPLPGYPTSGLLQFFIGVNDLFGADFDTPTHGTFAVRWIETPSDPGSLVPGDVADAEFLPFQTDAAWRTGVTLRGEATMQQPDSEDWMANARFEELRRRPGADALFELFDAQHNKIAGRHHIGGHPVFMQYDFRSADRYADYDRVLLRLTSDDHIMWGDCGEAVFMITADDLAKRDFSRVAYYWDCC